MEKKSIISKSLSSLNKIKKEVIRKISKRIKKIKKTKVKIKIITID